MLQVKSAQDRWEERVGAPRLLPLASDFPDGAVAVIYRPARSTMTSSKVRPQEWKLRFEPRSPRYLEPLMGWTGNDDTLSQVELAFPSVEAAVAYARRQGLNFVVRGLSGVGASLQRVADAKAGGTSRETVRPWRLEWIERTLGPEVIQQGVPRGTDASSGYANPKDVLADPALTQSEKRDVLQRWALDAYLIELALSKGLPVSHQSRLDDVIDALIDLDDTKPAVVTRDVPQPARTDRNAA